MPLIVEDNTGLANAESYISVADADVYLANMGRTSWAAATTAAKEIALRKATQYIDTAYSFRGARVRGDLQRAANSRSLHSAKSWLWRTRTVRSRRKRSAR